MKKKKSLMNNLHLVERNLEKKACIYINYSKKVLEKKISKL